MTATSQSLRIVQQPGRKAALLELLELRQLRLDALPLAGNGLDVFVAQDAALVDDERGRNAPAQPRSSMGR